MLQERYPDVKSITIIAWEFPTPSPMATMSSRTSSSQSASADYASMWAGAHYRPIPYLSSSHPQYVSLTAAQQHFHCQLASEGRLATRTAEVMKQLARAHPEAGVEIMSGLEYLENPPVQNSVLETGAVYAGENDGFRVYTTAELEAMNKAITQSGGEGIRWACEYETYVVNVHVYCAWLLQRFHRAGGRTVRRRLKSISEALQAVPGPKQPVIVNCSGNGLCNDPNMRVIRGQTVLVRNQYQSTVTRQCTDGTWAFLIPRPLGGGTIVGGTKQVSDSETDSRPTERKKILENAVRYFPDFVSDVKGFEVVQDNVGRRPWREGGLRIEHDQIEQNGQKVPVVHGYGAGGRGYELSWGAAEKICELLLRCDKFQPRL